MATKIVSVTESVTVAPTVAQTVAAIAASESASVALVEAGERDLALFADAASAVFAAIAGGAQAKDIAAQGKAAGLSVRTPSHVGKLRMVGAVLAKSGDLPNGVTSRDVLAQFNAQKVIASRKVEIACGAKQFAAIIDACADRTAAYKAIRKVVIANEAAARTAAGDAAGKVAPTEPTEPTEPNGDAPTEPVDVAPITSTDMLAEALALVEAAVAAGIGNPDAFKIANRITAVLVAAVQV